MSVNQTGVRYFCSFADGGGACQPLRFDQHLRRHCHAHAMKFGFGKIPNDSADDSMGTLMVARCQYRLTGIEFSP